MHENIDEKNCAANQTVASPANSCRDLHCQSTRNSPTEGISLSDAVSKPKARACKACERIFTPQHGAARYCSDACRFQLHLRVRHCKACGDGFVSHHGRMYCSDVCLFGARAPAVYRFVCPDGRSYVGAVSDCRKRADNGIARSNTRLVVAFEQHPPETWTYEVLEHLPPRCSKRELHEAEQRHIDRLRSWDPAAGFNIAPAIWTTRSTPTTMCAARSSSVMLAATIHSDPKGR